LDKLLSDAFLSVIKEHHPEWVHQEIVYQYVETNVTFTEKQLSLHIQKAGQVEPNWQHDLRNLQHSLKRTGIVINPDKKIWGLPVVDVDHTLLETMWQEAFQSSLKVGTAVSKNSVQALNGEIITKQLFLERISHLIQSGGVLPQGRFHVWHKKEQAIISLSNSLFHEDGWVSCDIFLQQEKFGNSLSSLISEFTHKASIANVAGLGLAASRKSQGVKRTVILHRPELSENTGSSLPFVFDRQRRRVTLNSLHPLLQYGGDAARRLGYVCPGCTLPAHAAEGGINVHHFRHFPKTKERLRDDGRTCPYFGISSAYSGLDAASRQFRQNLLQVRLKRQPFRRYSLFTDGGDDGLGLPQDPNRLVVEIGTIQNLSLYEIRRSVQREHITPVEIANPILQASISWRRNGMRQYDTLVANGIAVGDCFQIKDLAEFTVNGRGILRIRPGLDYDSGGMIGDYTESFIGIVITEGGALPPVLEEKVVIGGNLRLVILPTHELENRVFLDSHEIRVDLDHQIHDRFEVLVRRPMAAHPKGHSPIFLQPDPVSRPQSVSLLVRNGRREQHEDEVFQPVLSRFTARTQGGLRVRGVDITEYPLYDDWNENIFEFTHNMKNAKLHVDGSLNYNREKIKPHGGLMIYRDERILNNAPHVSNTMRIGFDDLHDNLLEICLFSAPPVVRYEMQNPPLFFKIHGPYGQLNSQEQFVSTSVWFANNPAIHNRTFPVQEITGFLHREQEVLGDVITKIQIQFPAQTDFRNKSNVGLPTIILEYPSEDILEQRRMETEAAEMAAANVERLLQEAAEQAAANAKQLRQEAAEQAAANAKQLRQEAEAVEQAAADAERLLQEAEAAEQAAADAERLLQEAAEEKAANATRTQNAKMQKNAREIQSSYAKKAQVSREKSYAKPNINLAVIIQADTIKAMNKSFSNATATHTRKSVLMRHLRQLQSKNIDWETWTPVEKEYFQCAHLHTLNSKEEFEKRMEGYKGHIGVVKFFNTRRTRSRCKNCSEIWNR
jgi:hypothetical protein